MMTNETIMVELQLELENLKSLINLWSQYSKELVDAKNGTGLCVGMNMHQRMPIINDLINHIDNIHKAVDISNNRIHEISSRC